MHSSLGRLLGGFFRCYEPCALRNVSEWKSIRQESNSPDAES